MSKSAALGTFRAIKTRDAVARTRDGWPYFEANFQGLSPAGEALYEIRFGDGEWMLAVADDLIPEQL
ncbi:hypothetical protein PJL15_03073 [Paenarthrobacter nitroguajacolicus]|nr:hypothetical protein [Paenarthrobacter nitroguajacolicus]